MFRNLAGLGGKKKVYLQNSCLKCHIYLELGALPSGKELCETKRVVSLPACLSQGVSREEQPCKKVSLDSCSPS